MAETIVPIPGPPPLPLIGNLRDIDLNNTIQSFERLAETYGPIFKLYLGGSERVFITNHELANEVLSRKDFVKKITGATEHLAKVMPEGILTATHGQESWGLTRRTLNPVFTKGAVKEMFPEMLDIASQLVLKWARFGPEEEFDVQEEFTRLSMDTIALCAMGTRFNSFYRENQAEFVQRFGDIFNEVQRRSNRPEWYTAMMWEANRLLDENIQFVRDFCAELVSERRANPADGKKNTIFDAMVNRRDPVSGKELSSSTITDNMITFLFAGHDTTSGLLSFVLAHLIMNPDAYAKLQEEVDRVLGDGAITPDHLNELHYTRACLRETLRLEPPSPGLVLMPLAEPNERAVVGGKYVIQGGQTTVVLIPTLHRDPDSFGPDADEFKPERMLEDNFKKLPKNAFKPFGNGQRSCIGNEFATQQAMMVTAILFQKFDFTFVDPDYELQYQPSLHRKAKDLYIRARLRPGVDATSLNRDLFTPATNVTRQ
ncbi:cytochrome P450 [Cercophora scortea]|uniref:Cytochrome P450 n=1 Tax=Cercophora scortea TaxID=314031 RepID=A0AAE0MAW7_9PEZI|nr:cytochrome P450 [Cercophora scortea]